MGAMYALELFIYAEKVLKILGKGQQEKERKEEQKQQHIYCYCFVK